MQIKRNFLSQILVFGLLGIVVSCARKERISFTKNDYSPEQGWVNTSHDWYGWYKEGNNYLILPESEHAVESLARFSVKASKEQASTYETFVADVLDHHVIKFTTKVPYRLISSLAVESKMPEVKHYLRSANVLASKLRDVNEEGKNYPAKLSIQQGKDEEKNSIIQFIDAEERPGLIKDAFLFAGIYGNQVLLEYRLYGKTYFMPAQITTNADVLTTIENLNVESKILFVHGRFGTIDINYIFPDLPTATTEQTLPVTAFFNPQMDIPVYINQLSTSPWGDFSGFLGTCKTVKIFVQTQDGVVALEVDTDGTLPILIPADKAKEKNVQPGDKIVKIISCDDKNAINAEAIITQIDGSLPSDKAEFHELVAKVRVNGTDFAFVKADITTIGNEDLLRLSIPAGSNRTGIYLQSFKASSCAKVKNGTIVVPEKAHDANTCANTLYEESNAIWQLSNKVQLVVESQNGKVKRTYKILVEEIETQKENYTFTVFQGSNVLGHNIVYGGTDIFATNQLNIQGINKRLLSLMTVHYTSVNIRFTGVKTFTEGRYSIDGGSNWTSVTPNSIAGNQFEHDIIFTVERSGVDPLTNRDIKLQVWSDVLKGWYDFKINPSFLSSETELKSIEAEQVLGTLGNRVFGGKINNADITFDHIYKNTSLRPLSWDLSDKATLQDDSGNEIKSTFEFIGISGGNVEDGKSVFVVAEDGTRQEYSSSLTYLESQAELLNIELEQDGSPIPAPKLYSNKVLPPFVPNLKIEDGRIIINGAYFQNGTIKINSIAVSPGADTDKKTDDILATKPEFSSSNTYGTITVTAGDGVGFKTYTLVIDKFMGHEAKIETIKFIQDGLFSFDNSKLNNKFWNIIKSPTDTDLNFELEGAVENKGRLSHDLNFLKPSLGADVEVFDKTNPTGNYTLKVTSEDKIKTTTYQVKPKYLSNCKTLTDIKFTQDNLYNNLNDLLPVRDIAAKLEGTEITLEKTVNSLLSKGKGSLKIDEASLSFSDPIATCKAKVKFNGQAVSLGRINLPKDDFYANMVEVITEDETERNQYSLRMNYASQEVNLQSIVLEQLGGGIITSKTYTSANTDALDMQHGATEGSRGKLTVKGAYFKKGEVKIKNIGLATGSSSDKLVNAVLVDKPNLTATADALVVTSEDKTVVKPYDLVFEKFMGDEAKLIKISLRQEFANTIIDQSTGVQMPAKSWDNISPNGLNINLNLPGVVSGKGSIVIQGEPERSPGATYGIFAVNDPTGTPNIITVTSEDGLTTQTYKINPTYLDNCATLNSIKFTQSGVLDYQNVAQTPKTLTPVVTIGSTELNANTANKIVKGVGRLYIDKASDVSLCHANAELRFNGKPMLAGDILNPSKANPDEEITVISEDKISKSIYKLTNIQYLNNGAQVKEVKMSYVGNGTLLNNAFDKAIAVTNNTIALSGLNKGSGILSLKPNDKTSVIFEANSVNERADVFFPATIFPITNPNKGVYDDVFYVISEDKTKRIYYSLSLDYLGENTSITKLVLEQRNLPGNATKTFSTDDGGVTIAGNTITVNRKDIGGSFNAVVKGRGKIFVKEIVVATSIPPTAISPTASEVAALGAELADSPMTATDHAKHKKIKVTASVTAVKEYSLVFNFLGNEANILSWRLLQQNIGKDAITNLSIQDKTWTLTNPTSPITLDGAYQNVLISYTPSPATDLIISEHAKVKTQFNPSSNTATSASIEIISEDTYTPKLYNITINRLGTVADLASATLSQTGVSGVIDQMVTLQKYGTNLENLKPIVGDKFVSGAGQFRITATPEASGSIIGANVSGSVALLNNTTSPSYNPAITVLSQDRRTKKEYNLTDVNYLNNGTTLKEINFTYSVLGSANLNIKGTVNTSFPTQINLDKKLMKKGTLTLAGIGGNAVYENLPLAGVSSSSGAIATMSQQTITNEQTCRNCLSVTSESGINTTPYTINYTYTSNEVGITSNDTDISFIQGANVFSIDNGGLVYDGATRTYTLQRVSASAGKIVFQTLKTAAGNTAKYGTTAIDFNNLNNIVLASPNPATPTVTPTTDNLILTAEDGTTTKTYTFKIEIVCANPTLEDLSITGIPDLSGLNLMSLAQNKNRDGSTNADSKVLLFRYDKDLPSLSSMQIRYKGKNFETTDYAYSNLVNYGTAVFQFDIKCSNKKLYIRHVDLRLTDLKHGVVSDASLRTAPLNITTINNGAEDFKPSIFTWNPAKGDYTVNYTLKYGRTGSATISLPNTFAVSQNASASDIPTTLTVSSLGFERQYTLTNKLDEADKGRLAYTTYDRTKAAGTAGHNVPNKHWFKYGAITELTSWIPGNVSLVRKRDGSLASLKNLWSFDGDVYKVNADGTITRLKSRPVSGTTHPWLLDDQGFFFIVYESKYVSPIMTYGSWDTRGNAGCKKNTPNGTWYGILTGNNMDINKWFPTNWNSSSSPVGDPYIFQDYNGSGYHCLSAGSYYLRIPFCSTCPDTYVEIKPGQGYGFDNETR